MATAKEAAPRSTIHVLGSGSLGLLMASSIRRSNPTNPSAVTVLLRPHHKERVLSPRELRKVFRQPQGAGFVPPPQSIIVALQPYSNQIKSANIQLIDLSAQLIGDESTSDQPYTEIKTLLLTTKAQDAVAAVQSVLPLMDKKASRIIVLSNGALAIQEHLASIVHPSTSIVLASTYHGAHRGINEQELARLQLSDSQRQYLYPLVHAGLGYTYVEKGHDDVVQILEEAGLRPCALPINEMKLMLWKKLAANCVINPLTAIFKCRNGALLITYQIETAWKTLITTNKANKKEIPWETCQDLMADVIKEVSTIALAETRHMTDIDVDELSPERIHLFVQAVISETAANHSSMLQDIFAGRRGTEIDFLNGYIQDIGKSKHGIQTPANSFLCSQVNQLLQTNNSNV
eukprot:CAMPEP_0198294344 /NCGR_PEP_ID=MMETSP1449-20131203/21919_1 /TAXON_ID=420275 /ORGANISM="Attheya septentrionalis, Strain CCMP2084" /LENGTH=403 /DNA_ID=CAMNT_0043994273 /DNA_START=142 /DNA_END=1349 /DNA_ORIENTATION=-